MAAKKQTPATPPTPPAANEQATPPTPPVANEQVTPPTPPAANEQEPAELPRKVKVKHKKTGNEFEVTSDYYQRNRSVLTRL